jgi:hypothetical protein
MTRVRLQSVLAAVLAFCAVGMLDCTGNRTMVAGGGTDVSNASVSGRIVGWDGVGIANTQIKLIPGSFLPVRDDPSKKGMSVDTTDFDGRYYFPDVKADTYSIQAVHLTDRTRMLRTGVVVREKDSLTMPGDSLSKPGTIGFILRHDVHYAVGGYIIVPGTDIRQRIDTLNRPVVLDSVPAGLVPSLSYYDVASGNVFSVVSGTVAVKPEATSIAGPAYCLVVIGKSTGLSPADNLIVSKLRSIGTTVTIKSDTLITGADTSGPDLVLISPTATSPTMQVFKTASVPCIVCQTRMYPVLGMTGSVQGVDYAVYNKGVVNYTDSLRQNDVEMRDVIHPISPNIAGIKVICNDTLYMVWGKPTLKAKLVASVLGDITKIILFTYTINEQMTTIPAPGRRVGLSFHEDVIPSLNPLGWTLFENSVYWALRMR